MAIKAILITVLAGLASQATAAVPDRVAYRIESVSHSGDEDRNTFVFLQKWGDSVASYQYVERVDGAITPTVTAQSFSNHADDEPPGRFEALKRALIAAEACDLTSDREDHDSLYRSDLRIHIGGATCELDFRSPPTEPRRALVHKLLMDYATDLKIDRPGVTGARVQTSQGDRETPVAVTIRELLARPEAYDGKRVAVTGYVWLEFEGNAFCAEAYPGDGGDLGCLWYGEPSSFAAADVRNYDRSWSRIEGVFFKGPAGHLGMSPGEITRFTKTEPALQPSRETP